MMDMRQALLYKPQQGVGEGWSPQGSPQPTGGGLRAWENASNFNQFMNRTPMGWGMQGIMPGGTLIGLGARANNAFANNAYTTAMNSREGGGIAAPAPYAGVANPRGGNSGNSYSDGGGYSGSTATGDEGNDTGSRGFY
jgi:hypothetical protein